LNNYNNVDVKLLMVIRRNKVAVVVVVEMCLTTPAIF